MTGQRVRRQRGPVNQVDGGLHDDDLVGLTGDVERSLIRSDTEVDQGKRLILIRANVHGAAHDAWVAVEVGASGSEGIVSGVDAR